MSQDIFTSINPSTTSGTQLATVLDGFKDAIVSGMSGASRPTALQAGGGWVDTTDADLWVYKVYTGSDDVDIFSVNLTTGKSSFAGTDSTFEISRISADTVGPIAKFIKQRIASSGQVLTGDIIGEMQFIGRGSDSSNPVVARIRAYASDNMGAAASGGYLVFETTTQGQTAAAEHMRLLDGKLGVGTTAPTARLHAEGSTGIKSSYTADSANPSLITLEKSRVAGTKASQNADDLGEIVINTTDSLSAQAKSASIKATATQAHTNTARGTKIVVATTDDGAAAVSDKISIGSEVETIVRLKMNALQLVGQSQATTATIAQLSAAKAVVEFTGSTATAVQGINSAHASKVVLLHNISTADITLEHENTGATAADRLKLPYSTPITIPPQSSIELFYSTTDSRWKLKSGSGSGSGSGGGAKNYASLLYAGTTVNGINTYDDTAAATPVDGTGGTATGLTTTLNTSTPLRGTSNIRLSKDASNRQGKGWSWDFTLDRADYEGGKPVTVQFRVKTSSGYVANDVRMFVYDKDGTTLLNVAALLADGSISKSDSTSLYTGTFYPLAADSDYRLVFHVASTTAAAWDMDITDLFVGPGSVTPAGIITDWVVYTMTIGASTTPPTKSASPTYDKAEWRRVGDSMEVRYHYRHTVAGSAGNGTYKFPLPSGYVIDTNKVAPNNDNLGAIGYCGVVDSTAGSLIGMAVYYDTTNISLTAVNSTAITNVIGSGTYGALNLATVSINFTATLPIVGWTSGALLSTTEAMLQTVRAHCAISASSANLSIADNAEEILDFDTKISDPYGAVTTGASWKFTSPKTAEFLLSVKLEWATTANLVSTYMVINKNGSFYKRIATINGTSAPGYNTSSVPVSMVKGDYIDVRVYQDDSASAARTIYSAGGTGYNYISIVEIPDFSIFSVYGITEYQESTNNGLNNYAGSAGVNFDITSLTLQPGEYDLTAFLQTHSAGATTAGRIFMGINTTSGNNQTGRIDGNNWTFITHINSSGQGIAAFVPNYRVVVTTPTIYYMKVMIETSVTNMQTGYRFSARRIK